MWDYLFDRRLNTRVTDLEDGLWPPVLPSVHGLEQKVLMRQLPHPHVRFTTSGPRHEIDIQHVVWTDREV